MVMGGDSHSKGRGLNPSTVNRKDMTFFNIDLLLKLYCLFERTENKQKRGTGLAYFFKKMY